MSASSKSQVYLVDFGLATHFNTDETFKPNPKKAHNGTIEYLSRDAHLGGKKLTNIPHCLNRSWFEKTQTNFYLRY